ncbi:MAG: polyphosphate polymerase domain-containing protein [Bacteroidaceae bacterium]|nr:polyphosphate polymerase domain-containing protein [Bacteroidaceae bacterium]
MEQQILQLLDKLPPISLSEMKDIKLMNRIDKKYLATIDQLQQLLAMAQGKYMVQQIEGKRYNRYHTIYLDTPDEEMYTMHHNGRIVRQKVRVRTYLDSGDTFLEVKNKNNHGRTKKKRMTVGSIHSLHEDGGDTLLTKHANYSLNDLVPKVENRFERITLVNMAKTERLTIDCHVKFHHWETDIEGTFDRLVIIELKRDGNVYSPVKSMLRELRIKPSGFSKYCIGSALTKPELRQGNFKPRFVRINKLLNNH